MEAWREHKNCAKKTENKSAWLTEWGGGEKG